MVKVRLHELKILPKYFSDVRDYKKNFELRKDDRDFRVGDLIELKEWNGKEFTGRFALRQICYILRNCEPLGLKEGYCILGLE